MRHPLLFPMAFYVLYMWALALYMFLTRMRSIRAGETSFKYFRAYDGAAPPERVLLAGQHYDNQFQVPILFLITCLTHLALGSANTLTLVLAWLFVLTRLVHSFVHLGRNRVGKRAMAFAAGWLMIGGLWLQLVGFAAGASSP